MLPLIMLRQAYDKLNAFGPRRPDLNLLVVFAPIPYTLTRNLALTHLRLEHQNFGLINN